MAESDPFGDIADRLRREITGNKEITSAIKEIEHAFSDFETNPHTKWTANKLRDLVTKRGEELMKKPKSFKEYDDWYKDAEIELKLQAIERNAKGISHRVLLEAKKALLGNINNIELRRLH
ncbi:MAG: hypothetical protein ABID38_02030 [Candidatus Diapherotrites archaeon]